MPRPPRLLLSQSYYHVMIRGNNRNIVFKSDTDYSYFLELVLKFKLNHPFDLYHYCLMPTHVHLLIRTNKASDFSTFMKKIELAYFHHYRQEYSWTGHFWQGRFKSQAVGKDAYFIQCGKYIELNPVRKGIVDRPEDYRYSSYKYYVEGQMNRLITTDFIYQEMGRDNITRQKKYQELIVDQAVEKTYDKNVWGSDYQRYREQDKINRKIEKV